jgi:hypothetical protein
VFVNDQSVSGTVTSQLGTNMVNTVLGQYSRRHYNFPSDRRAESRYSQRVALRTQLRVLDKIWETRIQGSDSLSWVRGNTSIVSAAM